jgi:hypothetical protein
MPPSLLPAPLSASSQTTITRVDANDEIYNRILDDEDFRNTLGEFYLCKGYERLGEPAA